MELLNGDVFKGDTIQFSVTTPKIQILSLKALNEDFEALKASVEEEYWFSLKTRLFFSKLIKENYIRNFEKLMMI